MLELVTVDWLRELCGLPEGAAGILLSGGTAANLTGLAVARRVKLGDSLPGAVAYFCDQVHASVGRALRLLGFAPEQLRALPADASYRLPLAALRAAVAADRAAGRRPFCVVASAGTTNCAAVDPLPEIADFCAAEDLWLHVDGAYGAAAVLTEEGRTLLAGIERADSLVLDPHKWLFQPFEVGCLMVRDGRHLRDTFRARPDYMQEVPLGLEEVSFHDYGLQLSRSCRALKLWMSLQVFGLDAFRAAIERGLHLARVAEGRLRSSPRFTVVTPAQLAMVTFRYVPAATADAEAGNRHLVEAVNADGFAMISSTVLAGRTALRLCTINPRTTEEELAATVRRIEELGRVVEASSP
jgi:glutamate/tyrosine decarboxylase-like PLP-dependent enzyme